MDATEQVLEVVIIGSRMASLMTAKEPPSTDRQVCVLDRDRSVNGCLASRRTDSAACDDKAQSITSRDMRIAVVPGRRKRHRSH